LASDLRSQLQATLGDAYILERELGGGGMSRVFSAEEVRLKRKVVVKVLSPELAQGISIDRFEREIQTAAALQQANIVPVLTAGDTNGLPFYSMPFVEGESLRVHVARGSMAVTEVIGIMRDVSKALAYAHQRGVVHRDIKPDNVMLSGGTAVVLDFGIAKAISAARAQSGNATLTQIGTSIGTPAYMAPEQAAGDPDIDHRADIYSLGAMVYELLAGQAVFAGRTPQRMLAAHMGEAPKPITELRPDIPAPLADLVMRCLAKDASGRPQSAQEIVKLLDTVTSGGSMQSMSPVLLGGPMMFRKAIFIYAGSFIAVAILAKAAIVGIGLPDWVFPGALVIMALGLPVVLWTGYVQRVTRRAMMQTPTYTPGGTPSLQMKGTMATLALKAAPRVSWYKTARGGMYALGGFVGLIGVFMVMRAFGIGPAATLRSAGKFGDREKLIVSEFKTVGGDTLLGATVTDAFRTALAQSNVINVLSSATVREVMRRMRRADTTRVSESVAREIATREGMKALLAGEITGVGGRYVLSARLVSTINNDELATFREEAADERDIIPAIGRLAKDVREKVGENLRRVQSARTLDKVTTPSLEALQKYVQGVRAMETAGDFERGKAFLEEAIALDSGFSMAYRKLAIEENNRFGSQSHIQMLLQRAFDKRDRLTESERLITEGSYYSTGAHPDLAKAMESYERLLEIDPKNVTALNNAAVLSAKRRNYEKALSYARRAVAIQPDVLTFWNNVIPNEVAMGRLTKAQAALDSATQAIPNSLGLAGDRFWVAYGRGDLDSAAAISTQMLAATSPAIRQSGADFAAGLAASHGQLKDAVKYRAISSAMYDKLGAKAATIDNGVLDALQTVWYRNDKAGAARELDAVLSARGLESIPVSDRPYESLIEFYARTDRPDKARAMLAAFDKRRADGARLDDEINRHRALGNIAMGEKKYDEAIREFRAADIDDCEACTFAKVALAHDLANRPDSAIAAYEGFVNAHTFYRLFIDGQYLPSSYKRLGELYEGKGNTGKAIENYQKFVALWKNADPELQPQVTAVKAKLAKLGAVEKPRP
jgi:tetratricopeptide (TPR) repeat protein/tRNA A-37 threonylcarbamoyl transferase component Bud32